MAIMWAMGIGEAASQASTGLDRIHCQTWDERIEAHVLHDSKKTGHTDSLTYFWFKDQMIHQSVGGVGGVLLHGPCSVYYMSGALKRTGHFRKGLMHGPWKYWQENGEVLRVERWRSGRSHVERGSVARRKSNGVDPDLGREGDKKRIFERGRKK